MYFPSSVVQDYLFVDEVVMFPVNSISGSTQCFDVPIVDNMAFEKDEDFGLIIGEAEENVMIGTGSISVTIHDDDCECMWLLEMQSAIGKTSYSLIYTWGGSCRGKGLVCVGGGGGGGELQFGGKHLGGGGGGIRPL